MPGRLGNPPGGSYLRRMMRPKLIGALLLCACVRNPATGKLQLDLVSRDQEVQMGQQAKQETEQTIGVYKENDGLTRIVEGKTKRLRHVLGPDTITYHLRGLVSDRMWDFGMRLATGLDRS